MAPTKYVDRPVPTISLRDFDARIDVITQELVDAAENHGFFCIVDHGITRDAVDGIFNQSARFFNQPDPVKSQVPFSPQHNAGWEKNAQIRPSTGAVDRKESYQMQFGEGMNGRWLSDQTLPGFRAEALEFMHRVQAVSERLMRCFARGLNFEEDYFVKAHDVSRPESQTVCRLLHYFETPQVPNPTGEVHHRAGAHADWDFLTLLFQKAGQSGLEICPGREVSTSFGYGDAWTKVEPDADKNAIVCNVGDLLMSWSDDRFKSTFHRVKAPCEPDDFYGERYSIAFFNQPCKDAKIQGPLKKYPMVTGEEFTRNAMSRNYQAIQDKLKKEKEPAVAVVEVSATVAEPSILETKFDRLNPTSNTTSTIPMVSVTLPLADPSPIEKLPAELLECILLEVAKHAVPPVTEDEDSESVVYRYTQEEEQACSLAFRLTSRRFRNCSWKAFGAYLGETIFDLRSRQSISNLTAASTCEHLAPWVTKLIIACAEVPPGYPLDHGAMPMRMEQAEWDQLRQDSYSDLLQIKLAEDSWYPRIWKQKGYGSPMTGSGIPTSASPPRLARASTSMSIIQEAGMRALQEVLAQVFFCFKNIENIEFYHQPRTRPGRYHNLFQKFRNIPRYREEEDMRNAGNIAHLGLQILVQAMVASKITVRTMTLAVDLDEHHAFITNIPSVIFAKASQKQARCISFESPADCEYRSALESVRNLHVETLEIEHRYGEEAFWKSINSEEAGYESEDSETLDLEEFPKKLAKTVKFHPPSFQVALERYWLKHPEGQSGRDE
ncbi:uncharacterized protein J4E78_004646 [Alternaria triticimaculans]|uniref:uncharacterized protein n=1 Tax=Alternaria triticimaculans TaxID=297637 RepID=UPI0020C59F29|nr:uncharacterized protein J4E78_004646 [Alternaria triticimaculans]KAI4661856.1 hypothetical protein J4E78_004646 [Alternaria triticimaculans]